MIKKLSTLALATLFLASAVAVPAAVLAQDESEPGQPPRPRGSQRAVQAQTNAQERRERVEQLRQERTADIQERVEQRRAQVRQDICERREQQIRSLIPRLANGSTRVLGAIDGVYERVQGFYDSGQLTVENYNELNDAVAEAQVNAQSAVEAASGYEFTFDCDNPSVGDQLFGFRESVADARDELKAYRSELVNLISSLRAAAAEGATSEADDEDAEEDDETVDSPVENSNEEENDA